MLLLDCIITLLELKIKNQLLFNQFHKHSSSHPDLMP
jgi:hypothetical protein